MRDEFGHFKRLHQIRNAIVLEKHSPLALFHSVGKGEQDMPFNPRAVLLQPGVRLLRIPIARHLTVHDNGIKMLGEKARLNVLADSCGYDGSSGACKYVALKFENSLFFFHEQHTSINASFLLPRCPFDSLALTTNVPPPPQSHS